MDRNDELECNARWKLSILQNTTCILYNKEEKRTRTATTREMAIRFTMQIGIPSRWISLNFFPSSCISSLQIEGLPLHLNWRPVFTDSLLIFLINESTFVFKSGGADPDLITIITNSFAPVGSKNCLFSRFLFILQQ